MSASMGASGRRSKCVLFTREDPAYRFEEGVVSATVIKLNKDRGSEGTPDQCQAEYQFMAYGALADELRSPPVRGDS
jgi:hypothetical protein